MRPARHPLALAARSASARACGPLGIQPRSFGPPPQRSPFTGADAAKAGMLMLAVNGLCTGSGVGVGALLGATAPLALAGFFIGFGAAIAVVIKRYGERRNDGRAEGMKPNRRLRSIC